MNLAWILVAHQSSCRIQEADLQGYFLARVTFTSVTSLHMVLRKRASLGGSVGCVSDWRQVAGSTPRGGQQHSVVEIDLERFSTVSLSLQRIQEGELSVSGERMCTILVNRLED